MSVELMMTSEEWYPIIYPNMEVRIMDPDGWDRQNWQYSWYEEQITEMEFKMRVMRSTCMVNRKALDDLENFNNPNSNLNRN